MRAVEQTAFGWPDGNCVRASWATLLGVPIEDVPHFDPRFLAGRDQLTEERKWIRGLGYDVVVVPANAELDVSPDVCHLVSGLSPRGPFGHRCVGRGGKLVWDPHPSHLGLLEIWSYTFLVPLVDPVLEPETPELVGFCGWC